MISWKGRIPQKPKIKDKNIMMEMIEKYIELGILKKFKIMTDDFIDHKSIEEVG